MAKLKSEVWQKKYDAQGIPTRDRFVRDSAKMAARFSGPLAKTINAIQKTTLFRSTLEKTLGIEKERILPTYAAQPFFKWFANRKKQPTTTAPKVVLFADTYLNYHEPNIGIAATQLLEGLGFEVILANIGCCQRPKISQGFLRDAKKEGTAMAVSYTHLTLPTIYSV